MDYRKYLGQAGEDYACRFIEEQGLEVLERNWRDSNRGELDILAREGNPQSLSRFALASVSATAVRSNQLIHGRY